MRGAEDEPVLAVPRARLPGGDPWRGLRREGIEPYLAAISAQAVLRPRSLLEPDPDWKQVIPYLVLRDGERLFLMRRTRAGGDVHLHERWSIGIGGHLGRGDDGVLGGLRREWSEEIAADFIPDFHLLGLLNDDEDAVGAVHLGVVFTADAAGRPVAVRETAKLRGAFATLEDVLARRAELETWSALVLDALEVPAARAG